jgi:multidrug efflux pump subunit AcrB
LAKAVKKEFVPSQDQSRFLVRLQTPWHRSIGFTDEAMKQAEALVGERPEVFSPPWAGLAAVTSIQRHDVRLHETQGRRPVAEPFKEPASQSDFIGLLRKKLKRIRAS